MVTYVFILSIAFFLIAYLLYGNFLSKKIFHLDNNNLTPAHELKDNIDYVPTNPLVLFGHHFSSIAGAGPIVGPIIASFAFGWLPAVCWIILGAIFVGGVHDFSSLVGSIRHRGYSIAEIAKNYISSRAYRLMLVFIWFSLVYVLTVFVDLTANTFKMDGGIATTSMLYILFAILFGVCIYRLKAPLSLATVIFVLLVFLGILVGKKFPLTNIPAFLGDKGKTWALLLVVYCFFASVLPVWFLLQPRDYLSSYLLYFSVVVGALGLLFGKFEISSPAFIAWSSADVGQLMPFLFVTIACGAVSGFHSLISSGTTSKQLYKETDALTIGYGAMLVEGVVAVIAASAVMILSRNEFAVYASKPPLFVYGTAFGKFVKIFGIDENIGFSFGLLALSTFILTTLDTATRIGRYIFQEFFSLKSPETRYIATIITLVLPTIFVLITLRDAQGNAVSAWKVIWPVFGASNQLLAALVLMVITVWLRSMRKKYIFTLLPMIFMLTVTISALFLLVLKYKFSAVGIIASILFLLSILLVREAVVAIRIKK
jgi:carbon starvation protein